MPKRTKSRSKSKQDPFAGLPPLNLNAAGIDVGNAEHFVAVPPNRDPEPVRRFDCFTVDLHRLADWLQSCNIDTVVIESTGSYWIPLYQLLEARGFTVKLVNAHHVKNVPGRKSDVQDCQWLQKLETFGLLKNSYRPPSEIAVLRTYWRQRDNLVKSASTCIQHMQKALTEMNIQLANVISDISGVTGLKIIRAILDGERNPHKLAQLKDYRIRSSQDHIAKSLHGDWREELLFVLHQSLQMYETYHRQIADCDRAIQAHLQTLDNKTDTKAPSLPPSTSWKPRGNAPRFDLRSELYRIAGVDLTSIDGIDVMTASVVISEVGVDVSPWETEKRFTSWLALAPDNQITGGKVIKRGTKRVKNRAAHALRMAASTLLHSKSALGANYRRLRARVGPAKAITAIAHKLARIIYRMLKYGQHYTDKGMQYYESKYREQRLRWLHKQAKQFNMQLVPSTALT